MSVTIPWRTVGGRIVQWAVAAAVILAIWQWVLAPDLTPVFFAGPRKTGDALIHLVTGGSIGGIIWTTVSESLAGILIGSAIGIVLALVVALSRPIVARIVEPFIAAAYATPKFALTPILFLWLGTGFSSRTFLVTTAVAPVVTIYLISGIRTVEPDVVRMFFLTGASRWQVGAKLLLPHSRGYFATAMAYVIPHAFTMAIGAEILFGASDGLGGTLFTQETHFQSADALAVLVVSTILAVFFGGLGNLAERRSAVERRKPIEMMSA